MAMIEEDTVTEILRALDRPIVLIGMMGAGKTRLGRQLSEALRLGFYDSDDEIEAAAGMDIPEIFERFGEPYFRDGEKRVIARLIDNGVNVIATGGGAVMNDETAHAVWTKTLSVWVRAEMDVMVERTGRKDNRPLLKNGDPRQILGNLADTRYPVYGQSNIIVDSHNGPAEAILNQAIEKIHDYLRYGQNKKTG